MAPLTSWRGGLLLLFSSSIFAGTGAFQIDHSLPVPMTQRLLGSFLRRKGGAGFLLVAGPAARATRSEPPCSMPPICVSRSGPIIGLSAPAHPAPAVWPGSPRPSSSAPQPQPSSGHPHRLLARRSRIGLDASSQLLMAPPSPEHPHSSGGVPQLHPTAKAWNRPEHPRHGPARPMRAAKYLASVPHSEAPQPAPPKPCHPAIQALRPGPQSQPAPTCSNSSNLNSHPTSIYYAFNL